VVRTLGQLEVDTECQGADEDPGVGEGGWGPKSRHLESRAKAGARWVIEVSAGWTSPSSRGLCGGHALILSTGIAAGNRNPRGYIG
jgi:hypothetical protein